ncbi:hypothetical protein BDW22DRAFT_1147975 [Trametopsis cervina]|nr:hypothetical protein BDW22DRAFT_1147975 [Trametopsis cervina]
MVLHHPPPIPIHEFLDAFLPAVNGQHAPRVDFSAVPQDDVVAMAMGEPFAAAVSQADCCPSFVIEVISKDPAKLPCPVRNYGIFSTAISDLETADIIRRVALVDVHVNFECQSAYDARKSEDEQGTRREDTQAVNTTDRRPKMSYINGFMTLQHRTHGFSIFIVGRRAHIARWHHTGHVVSTSFDYHSGASNWLGEFLFRYEHATPAVRGYDSTIQRAPDADRDTLVQAAHYYKMRSGCDGSQLGLDRTIYGSDAAYIVRLRGNEEDDRARAYVVRGPFTGSRNRDARGFLAWGLLEQELVCLKDTWHAKVSGALSEAEVYDTLKSCGVRFLPDIVAGDVVCDPDGNRQYTKTQEYFGRQYEGPRPHDLPQERVHRRSVQRLTLPLQNSKQLIIAIRDVVRAALCASESQDLSHRDIDTSNKTPAVDLGGLPDNADHIIAPSLNRPSPTYKMGIWQSLPILTVGGWTSSEAHSIIADAESCFWVFYEVAARGFEHLCGYLNLVIFREGEGRLKPKGFYVWMATERTRHPTYAIARVLFAFGLMLSRYDGTARGIGYYTRKLEIGGLIRQDRLDEPTERFPSVMSMLAMFDEALAGGDWP